MKICWGNTGLKAADMLDLLRISSIFLGDFGARVWMWILWSSNTSRSTRPPRWGGARIALMAASTPTWAPHATLRWSWPRRSRLSPNQRRRSPRRKRYEDVNEWHVWTNRCFCSLRLSEHAGSCCTDDHLGHLWMNHENKLVKPEQHICLHQFNLWCFYNCGH